MIDGIISEISDFSNENVCKRKYTFLRSTQNAFIQREMKNIENQLMDTIPRTVLYTD